MFVTFSDSLINMYIYLDSSALHNVGSITTAEFAELFRELTQITRSREEVMLLIIYSTMMSLGHYSRCLNLFDAVGVAVRRCIP